MIVTLIAAQSLDGRISRHEEPGVGFAGPEDKAFLRKAVRDFDSMIMGRKTFDTVASVIEGSTSTRWLRLVRTRYPYAYSQRALPDKLEFSDAAPADLLRMLQKRGRARCALLGGSECYSDFLAADLVDELWLTLEPMVFGSGAPLAAGRFERRFGLASCERLGQDTLLVKYVRKSVGR